jgi:RHS repeat-associated protein
MLSIEGLGCYRYNGKELSPETGLYAYGFRYYDPTIGRFTGVDPISDQFPHVSTYNYAENEPIAHIDLHGLQKVKPDPTSTNSSRYPSNSQSASDPSINRTLFYMITHPVNSATVGLPLKNSRNISSTSMRLGRRSTVNSNAVRHVTWQAMITSELGEDVAVDVGNAHENGSSPSNADVSQSFDTREKADQAADLNNNVIGRELGKSMPGASGKDFAISALEIFATDGLYTISRNEDGTFSVGKSTISSSQLLEAVQAILSLDQHGMNASEQRKQEQRERMNSSSYTRFGEYD